ncbi:flagellar hook protein FlgE [Massilia horti]|uniref:Flagellar hook protein FlgE n=1 Tax=Massilia horti TaxID=2562153 RepID=A0A4Y9SSW3_9BURK|nr:flagellar hook-basal body complex protein [Massilia horti]TFW29701.1 flagellar hook-basal body complex protein [Massilia horti]
MSFDIALSGIKAINNQLEAVSNNIANSGTYGFKSSRANFASLYAGTSANGVEVGSMTQNIGMNGAMQTTGRSMDAAITGRGFFVTRDQTGVMTYTRVGIFNVNKDGYVVDSAGRNVQGFGAANGGASGVMGDIRVPTGQIPAVASTKLSYEGNLSADWKTPLTAFDSKDSTSYNMAKQSVVYDSLGDKHTLTQYFVKTNTNEVTVYYAFDGAAIKAGSTPAPDQQTLTFNNVGQLPPVPPSPALSFTPANGAAALTVSIDYSGTTQFAGEATTTTNNTDGYASGVFVGVEVAPDGSVIAKYSNEQQQAIGTIAIATFPNEGALSSLSNTSWAATVESGTPLYDAPGKGLNGKLSTGTLEGSNVDITSELVGLMTSQRNYQANSKVISTENQMMQALMQAM